jgi:hexosaminidase
MSWPALSHGSFSAQEWYLQSEIADVVEYARQRAVRVMVEFDMPGHAAAWCKGYPEVCPSAACLQPLNVASNKTWDMITALLHEMTGGGTGGAKAGLFPDSMLHLGGDGVNTGCSTKTLAIAGWLKNKNMSAGDAYGYFVKRAAEIAISQGRRPVQWNEVFRHFGTQLDK